MRAIRSSLAHAMTPIECLGIMERDGEVGLRIDSRASTGALPGAKLYVFDKVNHSVWGQVRIVEVEDDSSLCRVYDRTNSAFWERLEDRMAYDTSPPNVYLAWEVHATFLATVEWLLDNWR